MMPMAAMGLGAGAILLFAPTNPDPEYPSVMSSDVRDLDVPIQSLQRKLWLDFVRVNACSNPRGVSPNYRLGVFEMTVRRLCDLGVMENPRRFPYKNTLVWDADWREPSSLKAFLHDTMIQYDLFSRSIAGYAADPKVLEMVGSDVDGQLVTLSGALAVAHRAGLPGLCGWFGNSKERARFARNTTSYFQRANGVF